MPLNSRTKSHGEDGLLAQVHDSQAPVNLADDEVRTSAGQHPVQGFIHAIWEVIKVWSIYKHCQLPGPLLSD